MSGDLVRRAQCYLLAAVTSTPVWIVRYPPIQDLPLHVATIRILTSFRDPAYGFADNYVLTLGRTQYVLYHLVGAVIARLSSPMTANTVLMSAYLTGTVVALEWLLRELGNDGRLSLFVIPLLVNVPFVLGLLPFLLGVPLLLAATAEAVRFYRRPTVQRGVVVSLLAMALFYVHIVPFLLFGVVYLALMPWRERQTWARAALPWAPVMPLVLWWALFTAAGRIAAGTLLDIRGDAHRPWLTVLTDFPDEVTHVFRDSSDQRIFLFTLLIALGSVTLAACEGRRGFAVRRAYVVLPLACGVCYFTFGDAHGYVFFIAERFAILFLITAIPLLTMPATWRGHAVTAVLAIVAVLSVLNTCRHFRQFDRSEVGNFDGAVAAMAPQSRVCALIADPVSQIVRNAAFLHFGSYYQAQKGGVVMFTYAGYPHWPVDFAPGKYPPPGGPARLRWEWTPQRVAIGEIYPYYDYVLTRGYGFAPPPGTYREIWHADQWAVWTRQ